MTRAERYECIAAAARRCEEMLAEEQELLRAGDLLGAADCADAAEACSVIAFNLGAGL